MGIGVTDIKLLEQKALAHDQPLMFAINKTDRDGGKKEREK